MSGGTKTVGTGARGVAGVRGVTPAPSMVGARAYEPQAFEHPIDLDLSANEGPAPAAWLRDAVRELDLERVRTYPHVRHELEARLAERLGVPAARVLVTAGGDEAIDRCCRAVLAPGRRAVMTRPTFEMIPKYAALAGATCEDVEWMDGAFPADAFIERARGASLAAMVSPNNPTGLSIAGDEMARVARALPGTLVLADLAYAEFAEDDPTGAMLDAENVVIVRTFSKAWGLAGLRVGYAIAQEPVITWLRAAAGPYSVSGASVAIALRAVDTGEAWMREHAARVRGERSRLVAWARAAGLRATASEANFVLVRCGSRERAGAISGALSRAGIAVRHFAARVGMEDALRISCPSDDRAMDRLLGALDAACGQRGSGRRACEGGER